MLPCLLLLLVLVLASVRGDEVALVDWAEVTASLHHLPGLCAQSCSLPRSASSVSSSVSH